MVLQWTWYRTVSQMVGRWMPMGTKGNGSCSSSRSMVSSSITLKADVVDLWKFKRLDRYLLGTQCETRFSDNYCFDRRCCYNSGCGNCTICCVTSHRPLYSLVLRDERTSNLMQFLFLHVETNAVDVLQFSWANVLSSDQYKWHRGFNWIEMIYPSSGVVL